MADFNSLSDALNSPNFAGLSPDAKQYVFDKYSKNDAKYTGLSDDAKQYVQQKYLGGTREKITNDTSVKTNTVKSVDRPGWPKDLGRKEVPGVTLPDSAFKYNNLSSTVANTSDSVPQKSTESFWNTAEARASHEQMSHGTTDIKTVANKALEAAFGPPIPQRMTAKQRGERFVEAAKGGAAVGTAFVAPFAAASVVATPLASLTELGAGAFMGSLYGIISEGMGQATAALGGDKGVQLFGEMAVPGAVPEAKTLLPKLAKVLNTVRDRNLTRGVAEAIQERNKTKLYSILREGGATEKESEMFSRRLFDAVDKRSKGEVTAAAARDVQTQRVLQQTQNTIDRLTTETEQIKNTGVGVQPTNADVLGADIRMETLAAKDPQYSAMKGDYSSTYENVSKSASLAEKSGDYFGKTPGANSIISKWMSIADKSNKDISARIRSALDEIKKGSEKTSVERKQVRPGLYRSETKTTKPVYGSFTGIDQTIRKLGDDLNPQATDYSSAWAALAGELRADITKGVDGKSGFYDWSGLGASKAEYAAKKEELSAYETKLGKAITEKQGHLEVFDKTSKDLPRMLFGKKDNITQFKQMVPDPSKQNSLALQHAANEIEGKNLKQTLSWMQANRAFLEEFPKVNQNIRKYVDDLGSKEAEATAVKQRYDDLAEQAWTPAAKKQADQWKKESGLFVEGRKLEPSQVGDALFGVKGAGDKAKIISHYAIRDPELRAMVPSAAAEWLSGFDKKQITTAFNEHVKPFLTEFGVNPERIKLIENRVRDIARNRQSGELAWAIRRSIASALGGNLATWTASDKQKATDDGQKGYFE